MSPSVRREGGLLRAGGEARSWPLAAYRRWAEGTAVIALAGFTLHALDVLGGTQLDTFFDDWVYDVLLLMAVAGCAARVLAVRAERAAWLALWVGLVAWTVGDWLYTYGPGSGDIPSFPALSDAFYLIFYPASYLALGLLVRRRVSLFSRSMWLDGVVAGLTAAAVGGAVLFQVVLDRTHGSRAAVITNLAYPLGDVLLLGFVVGIVVVTRSRHERLWLWIGAGFLTSAVADGIYLYQAAAGTYVEGTTLDVLWPASMLLLARAAWEAPRPGKAIDLAGGRLLATPALCGLIGAAILTYDHFHRLNVLALVLSIATLLAVVARTGMLFSENGRILSRLREQAVTDSLTGLGNRRKLNADLQRCLMAGSASEPQILIILDLNGFKRYNDTYGHPAGDALLARLSRRLDDAVSPSGAAYRLGGDEFCALAGGTPDRFESLAGRVSRALSERGDGFSIDSSFGAVLLPDETTDASEALRLADGRLYAEKQRNNRAYGAPHDILLRALCERDPYLTDQLEAVARLAASVGEMLGVAGRQLDELRQAAQLHDVGMLAVPDEILQKSEPLTAEDWRLIREHPLIGQRILNAAPALLPVASVVRSTHERWDGSGYPDGLATTAIPRNSRIIAACDAFFIMLSGRPYRPAVGRDEALAELRRCCGRQFDPEVVAALVDVVEADPAIASREWIAPATPGLRQPSSATGEAGTPASTHRATPQPRGRA